MKKTALLIAIASAALLASSCSAAYMSMSRDDRKAYKQQQRYERNRYYDMDFDDYYRYYYGNYGYGNYGNYGGYGTYHPAPQPGYGQPKPGKYPNQPSYGQPYKNQPKPGKQPKNGKYPYSQPGYNQVQPGNQPQPAPGQPSGSQTTKQQPPVNTGGQRTDSSKASGNHSRNTSNGSTTQRSGDNKRD